MRYFLIVFLIAMVEPGSATTWMVDDDGGPFQTIQSAIDMAASGDTIRIAAGEYPEHRVYSTDGWTSPVNVLVTQAELTIIGDGMDATFIGKSEPWAQGDEDSRCIVAASWFGARAIRIRDLTVRNARTGINVEELDEAELLRCGFTGILHGVNAALGRATLRECRVVGTVFQGTGVFSWYQDAFQAHDCEIITDGGLDTRVKGLSISGSMDPQVSGCLIRGGSVGLQVIAQGDVRIDDCDLEGQGHLGLYLKPTSTPVQRVSNCRFIDQDYALKISIYGGSVSAMRLSIDGVERASVYAHGALGRVEIVDSWLDKGTQGVLYSRDGHAYEPTEYFMPNNWWGTADADSIAAWIQDASDHPEYDALVEYVPFLSSPPVAIEQRTLSDLKALLR